MATQLLIYETAVPITQGRHGTWSVEVGADYAFSRHVNSVPLMTVEFSHAEPEYAIVFAGTDETVMPAVILGMRGSENPKISASLGWPGVASQATPNRAKDAPLGALRPGGKPKPEIDWSESIIDGNTGSVLWDDTGLKSSYANMCTVSSTREEIILVFGINHALPSS